MVRCAGRRQVRDGGDAARAACRSAASSRATSSSRTICSPATACATALNVLRTMALTRPRRWPISRRSLTTYPQVLMNVRVREKVDLKTVPADRRRDRIASSRRLAGKGRLLVRYSGTEPLLRVMLEGHGRGRDPAWGAGDHRRASSTIYGLSGAAQHGAPVRQRQQGRDAAQLARRRSAARARSGARVRRRRRARHHRSSRAPTRGTSRPTTSARSRRCCAPLAAASSSTSKATRGPICSRSCARCARRSARWCRSRPERSPARLAGRPTTPRDRLPGVVETCSDEGIRVSLFVDPDDDAIRWAAELGPTGSSSTPSRLPARSNGARRPRRTRSASTPRRGQLAHSLGLGVNAGHDLDLDNLRCSGRCRISTRSPSATP